MSRVRISTTVDGTLLDQARRLVDGSDSELLDRALRLLTAALTAEHELSAMARDPYEADIDLSWVVEDGPALPYDGGIPAEVIERVRRRGGRA